MFLLGTMTVMGDAIVVEVVVVGCVVVEDDGKVDETSGEVVVSVASVVVESGISVIEVGVDSGVPDVSGDVIVAFGDDVVTAKEVHVFE